MAENNSLGLPQILIDFKTSAATAFIRSSRGTVAMILNDENLREETKFFTVNEAADIEGGLTEGNVDLIKKCLVGTPEKIHVYAIPLESWTETQIVETTTEIESTVTIWVPNEETEDETDGASETVASTVTVETTTSVIATVQSAITAGSILPEIGDMKFNYICHPTGNAQNQSDLAAWVKAQRKNKNKTFKAVVAHAAADSEGVINFTTENIRVTNPAYTDALAEVNGDVELLENPPAQYVSYTAAQYTSRIAGILAGIALDRSATYYQLGEVADCKRYSDIGENIDAGELCLIDEHDGNGVKIARGVNSLTTFTAEHGEDLRFLRIVEAVDLIADDISNTFKSDYVGKVINSLTNKNLLISAINTYFTGLVGQGILSGDGDNYVEIDLAANLNWAKQHSIDTSDFTEEDLRAVNTGSNVFLTGIVHPLNSMEDLQINFTLQ